MGLAVGDKSLQYAIGGSRGGAFRGGALSAKVFCYVNDVLRDISDLRINERKGAGADSASFIVRKGWEPQYGDEVILQHGSRNRLTKMFGGIVTGIDEGNFTPAHRILTVSLSDWSWAMNADLVTGIFTGTYDEIALELMERHAPPGFTTNLVERGLPTVNGGIQFTQVLLSVAIDRLAKRGGIIWRMRYDKDLYFRLTYEGRFTDLRTIDLDNKQFKAFKAKRDYFNIVTRVDFECKGTTVLSEVSAGESIVPVLDGSIWPASGLFKSGPQIVEYLNVVLGGGGSLVGPGASPSNAPTVVLASGVGVTSGRHGVAFAYITAAGTSLTSPRSYIDVGSVSAPVDAATAGTPSSGGNMNAGTHRYYPVFRTAAGSTTAGPASNPVTAIAVQAAPTLSGYAVADAVGGSLDSGVNYRWKFGYQRNSDGALTTAGPASQVVFIESPELIGAINLTALGIVAPSGFSLVWYRTEGGGATFKRVTTFSYGLPPGFGGSDTYFIDGSADGTLGAVEPASDETGKGTVEVTGIPVSPEPLVTHVDMYREFNNAGAATAKLAFSVVNGVTSGSDTLANSGLGATVPSTNTAAANRIDVGLQIGPTGVTGRKVYLTDADDEDGTLKLAATVANNVDEEVEVATADGSLGAAAESVDGSGLEQPSGVVLAGATEIPIAGTAPFRAGGGWAVVGNYCVRYQAATATELTGVPTTGVGSLPGPINYNTPIAQAPQLEGISSGSPDVGSLTYRLLNGQEINIIARVDNVDAQTLLASKVGGSGVKTVPLQNRTLTYTEGRARAQAYLDRRSQVSLSASIKTKDCTATVGRMQPIDLPSQSINDTLEVQSVAFSNFHPDPPVDPAVSGHGDYFPDRQMEAADDLIALEDLLRKDAEN